MEVEHSKAEMLEYAKDVVKNCSSLTQDGHPNEGRFGIRMADKTYIVGDRFSTYAVYPLANGNIYMVNIHNINGY